MLRRTKQIQKCYKRFAQSLLMKLFKVLASNRMRAGEEGVGGGPAEGNLELSQG